MTGAYYNEIEPYAAQWLRNLIKEGLIADGEVDTRSIVDVRPSDLVGFQQCHFFAGLGGWSGALRLAGFPDDRPVWTGSCPCQPFSLAGKQKGFADDRHLWPVWRELIRERRPAKVFGEQVASASEWLGLVRGDLEAMGYAVGAIPIEAASAGADHLRDRFWFVGDDPSERRREGWSEYAVWSGRTAAASHGGLEHASIKRRNWCEDSAGASGWPGSQDASCVADAHEPCEGEGRQQRSGQQCGPGGDPQALDWVIGADGKARRVGPDLRRLVDGLSDFLAGLRAGCYAEAQRQVRKYGQATSTRSAEVLRAVWERVLSQPAAYEAMGEPAGVRGAEILLPFLRELGQRAFEEADSALPGSQELDDAMRSLRFGGAFARASLRRGYPEQLAGEHSDTLHALSWLLAQHARTAWEAHRRTNAKAIRLLEHNVPARVAKLRAIGNAIDPRPAAEFIRAAMSVRP